MHACLINIIERERKKEEEEVPNNSRSRATEGVSRSSAPKYVLFEFRMQKLQGLQTLGPVDDLKPSTHAIVDVVEAVGT